MAKPKKKVLIVDDDAHIRESVRLAILEQDFVVFDITESSNVASGILRLGEILPDIVILDLHMPDKTGLDFAEIMRKDIRFAKTRVIMLTADDTIKNILKAENVGIDPFYFLGKPFNISDLQAMVLEICFPSH